MHQLILPGPYYYKVGLQVSQLNCQDNAEAFDVGKSLLEVTNIFQLLVFLYIL